MIDQFNTILNSDDLKEISFDLVEKVLDHEISNAGFMEGCAC